MSVTMFESRPAGDATPAAHDLHAAYLLGQVFTTTAVPTAAVRPSYASLRTGGLFNEDSLLRAQRLLEELGLLDRDERTIRATDELAALHQLPEPVFVEALLQRWLVARAGLWLYAFARDPEPNWGELVPEAADRLLAAVYENPEQRRAVVRMLAHKVDADALAELGARGEVAVERACRDQLTAAGRPDLAEQVARVSLHDDTLGFDVTSADCRGLRHNMEVKTTGAPAGPVEFYLSRNEVLVGAADPRWVVVVARRGMDDLITLAGWLPYRVLEPLLPTDADASPAARARWASIRVTVDEALLTPGLPLDAR